MHAILLTNTLMRDNGQASSALDLAIAARSRGIQTSIAVMVPPLSGVRRATAHLDGAFGPGDVGTVPWGVRAVAHAQEHLSPVRRVARRGLRMVRDARQVVGHAAASRRFAEADVVVVASSLSHVGLARLRSRTRGRLLLNHAGSVASFSGYWLTPEHVAVDAPDDLARYAAFIRQYDAVLFQGPDQLEECAQLVPDLRARLFVVRPSANEPALEAARASASPFDAGRAAVVYVGSLQPRKAQHVAIDAFAAIAADLPASDLHFVGAPFRRDYAAQLAEQVARLGLADRVRFHGHRDDYDRFIAHADVVLHSSDAEGVSRVLREAMFLERPIVATDISGTRDALEHGVSAWLAPPGDPAALADALRRVLGDPALAAQLGRAGLVRYLARHAAGVYADGIAATLRAVADVPPVPAPR